LRTAYTAGADNEVLVAMGQHAIATLAGHAAPVGSVDARISRAIAWVRARLDSPVSLKDAAGVANLSPSRFRHLFVAQTGVSFRAYLLWARVETAVGAAMSGQSWTAAAQDAGFADSAHLSRTCRRMFGFAPASLIRE
jgi:AraC-like DNA-binding protein